jgi:hypothetical protein
VPRHEHPREEAPVPPRGYHLYSRMATNAAGAAYHLRESWERPKRHNKRIERAALWYVLAVGVDCDDAVTTVPGALLLRELRPEARVEERYEIQAAIHAVRYCLPFGPGTRDVLNQARTMDDFLFESDQITDREPALVEQWHNWVWADEHHAPQTSVHALGASAILAEGCLRLSQYLPTVLGEP